MGVNRKEFIKYACLTGVCMCGFSALASTKENSEDQALNLPAQDNNAILMQEWISGLLSNLNDGLDKATLRKIVKKNAIVHYNNLKMDDVLKDYENNLEKFIVFLETKWNWKIEYNAATNKLVANENKSQCVCPMVNKEKGVSPAMCYCSEGFAENMFSKVMGKPVTATVVSSIQRGDKYCQYNVEWTKS